MTEDHVDPRITDPDARAYLIALGRPTSRAGLTAAEIRARPRVPLAVDPSTYRVHAEDGTIPGTGLRARTYRPTAVTPTRTMLYLHGGGWALGDLDINDDVCRFLVDAAGIALVSLEYPLAPEHPFPAALDAATDVAARIVDGVVPGVPGDLVLGGLSAGAALAAGVALRGRAGTAPVAGSLTMLSPVADSDLDRPSMHEYADAPILTRGDMAWFWSMYDADGAAREDPFAAPFRATAFDGLPRTSIVVSGVDPLRDEGVAFGAVLEHAGVDVVTEVVEGVPHGFMAVPAIRSGRAALRRVAARI